jgi:RHS repeat-associated protein
VSGNTLLTVTAATLVSIAVTPASPTIAATATQQFTATGTFSDSSTQNLTASVLWASSSTTIATINSSGLATAGAAAGSTIITATSGSVIGSTSLTVTASSAIPTILSVVANSGLQGQSISVIITGTGTHFVNGTTKAIFGPGIAVGTGAAGGFGAVTVTSSTTATAQLNISASAPFATRTVGVMTGAEQESLISGFSVNGAPMVLYVSPNSANPGTSVAVSIVGMFTHFQQGTSVANFGAGISVGGGAPGAAGPITVTNATTATANLTVGAGATLGLRAPITVTTGTESAPWSSPGFFVLGPVTGPFPDVTIISPIEGAEVTTLTTVTGTVTSPNLAYWNLAYEASGSTVFTQFATGTGATVTGTLDPTVLLNGVATIQLTGVDQSGQTSITVVHVIITRNAKIGNFTLSFIDLNIPVSGIPIQVVRKYDSRSKSVGDFGFNWSLAYKTTQVQTSDMLGNNWQGTEDTSSFFPVYCVVSGQNYVASVTLQDGSVYQFSVNPTAASQCAELVPPETVDLAFTPIGSTPAGATLTQDNSIGLFIDGSFPGPLQLLDGDFEIYGTSGDDDGWTLTLPNGQVLQVSVTFGLQSIADPNGNTLTFGDSGITSSAGKGVTFVRDAQSRITTITDPNGNVLNYAYDAAGDLNTYTDARGNVSTFTYDGNHGLLSYKDPSGMQPIRNIYDDSGRLIQQIDAFGNVINFTNSTVTNTETYTDALGNSTTYNYDGDGNVLEKTDALGEVTQSTFDANDDQLTLTNPLGNTITYTYDSNKNKLSETDALGHLTTYTYNSLNQLLTITDPNGNVTANTYDATGNLLTTTDGTGAKRTNVYNALGLQTSYTDPLGNVTTYTYDAFGDQIQVTDAQGHITTNTYDANGNKLTQTQTRTTSGGTLQTLVTSYQYDGMNNLIQTTYPDGSTAQTSYTPTGQQSSATDQLGRITSYQYDAEGRQIQVTYPDGTTATTTYDAMGNKVSTTDQEGRTTSYTYDAVYRNLETIYPDASITSIGYDKAGEKISSTDQLGNVTENVYDAAGRNTQITDALHNTTTFAYDGYGNQTSMTDANGHTTTYLYDGRNRRTKSTYPDSTSDSVTYDGLARTIVKTNQAGRTTQFGYDSLGHLSSVTDALSQITKYGYDEVSDRISQTDANGHVTTFSYNQVALRIGRSLPGGQTESFTYDAYGNELTHTDFNGKITTYTYDALNRLLTQVPDSSFHAPTVSFTYTATGKRASMNDAVGATSYTYDQLDRLTAKTAPQGTLNYNHNAAGGLTQLQAGALTAAYTYDADNRLASVAEASTGTTSLSYDAAGNLLTTTYPNGVAHDYTYDTLNRLTDLAVNKSATHVASYAYTLDPAGHRLTSTELSGRKATHTYDNIYRLMSETVSGATVGPNGAATYTYDPVGNRTQTTSTLSGVAAGSFSYNSDDRLSTDTYDADGNTTASGGVTNTYDFENHLIQSSSGVTIVYDGDGNRVSKSVGGVTTTFLVDDQNPTGYVQVITSKSSNGNTHDFVYGLERVSQVQFIASSSTTLTSYYVYDGQGSVRALTSSAGAVTDTYDYDAFGNLLNSTGTTPNNYLYTGEEFDPDLHVYYLRARYLNTVTGRFLTIDPYLGDLQDPLSLHRYLYAGVDPVNHKDPTGQQFDMISISISIDIDISLDSIDTIYTQNLIKFAVTAAKCIFCLINPGYELQDLALDLIGGDDDDIAFELYQLGQDMITDGFTEMGKAAAQVYIDTVKSILPSLKVEASIVDLQIGKLLSSSTFKALKADYKEYESLKGDVEKAEKFIDAFGDAEGDVACKAFSAIETLF